MAELDLENPEHLCELLRRSLPGFDEETAARVGAHVEALERSDNDIFGMVGAGRRHPEAPAEQLPPDAQAGQAPDDLPLDLGGEGQLIEAPGSGLELGRVLARRGWTELDRVAAKGHHEIYTLVAKHIRRKPIRAGFTANCQSVRVRLPLAKPAKDAFIGTWIGTVEAKDHLAFSVEQVASYYERACGERPSLARVDLITGPRFRGRRFSPVSIYLAYRSAEAHAKPCFYLLEGGSASGKAQAMYVSRSIETGIKSKAKFAFTPFACASNWYDGGLAMSEDLSEPACVYLKAAQTRDGHREYLQISVTYARDHQLERVAHPFEQQIEAALRVTAIADEARCQLEVGAGGVLQHSLGPMVKSMIPWDERPNGTTTPQERDQFCGCPKTS
ncbi:hypothetical protein DB30_08148 [Enhygromyxa salina]|uniref:Uncharacterized protein n=1 Tax=Enhygromyxa salina TaxID=215803 RepID=A0A0C2CQB4_9BACT|nr:DUF1365 family protein [Enhygromyxa salina]KIG13381.1 hypothetical protein DB30_08148 [Enhygromyxa salina]